MEEPDFDLIKSWDETFSFKITENNLKRPDEQFLFTALVTLLQGFNVDVEPFLTMYSSENCEHRKFLKMKFVRYVDYFYKSAVKSHTFYYYDLIKPTPKKTAFLLIYLLNYFHHYQTMKVEVFNTVERKLKEREDIIKQKKELQRENNELAIKASSIENKMKQLIEALPKLDEEVLKHKKELEQLEKSIQESQARLKDQNDMIILLKEICETEEKKVVSPEEIEYIKKKITFAQKAIEKEESILKEAESKKKKDSELFAKRELITKRLQNILNEFIVEDLISFSNSETALQEISLKLTSQTTKNEEMKNKIRDLERKVKEVENKMELAMENLSKVKCVLGKFLQDYELALAEKNGKNNDAKQELKEAKDKLETLKEVEEHILEMTVNFFQTIYPQSDLSEFIKAKDNDSNN